MDVKMLNQVKATKMKMKKTNMLLTAALAVLAVAGLTACSGAEDEPGLTKSEPAAAPRTVTLTTTVTRDAEPTRGTLTEANNQLYRGFQNGDKVAVVYHQDGEGWRKVEGTLSGANGGSATLTAELENPSVNTKRIVLIYPASLAKETVTVQNNQLNWENCVDWDKIYNQQDGAWTTLPNFDLAVWGGDMTITAVPNSTSVASLPADLPLKNQLAICKINIKDEGDTQRKVNKLLIDDGTNQYTVSSSTGQSLWYVAMRPISSKNVYFHAEVSSGNNKLVYYRRATDVTLAKNTYYVSNLLKMNTGKYERGWLLASDGYPYKTESDMEAFEHYGHDVSPAGLIVWGGAVNGTNRGMLGAPDGATGKYCLVMAPRDAYMQDGMNASRKTTYDAFKSHLESSDFDATYLSGTVRPDGATAWVMPTATAFMLALDGNGNSLTTFSTTDATAVSCSVTALNELMQAASSSDAEATLTAGYWTSSEAPAQGSGNKKWVYHTSSGQFEPIDDTTSGTVQLRPVFWYQPN